MIGYLQKVIAARKAKKNAELKAKKEAANAANANRRAQAAANANRRAKQAAENAKRRANAARRAHQAAINRLAHQAAVTAAAAKRQVNHGAAAKQRESDLQYALEGGYASTVAHASRNNNNRNPWAGYQ
jgi:colicin import membrane protein